MKRQRRWDTRAGVFLPVAQCAAPPASSSRIQHGQTLPLAEGLIPLRCCALCFGGLPELQKAGSVCQPPPCCKGSREALEWCIPILSIDLSPKSPAFGCQREVHAACPGSLVLWRIPPLLHHVQQRSVINPQLCTIFPFLLSW